MCSGGKEEILRHSVILVSPAPVDAYPPVQYQARLLAECGARVVLITSPVRPERFDVSFSAPGVEVELVDTRKPSLLWKLQRIPRFSALLSTVRRRLGNTVVAEIAFNPDGVLISDVALFRPDRRVAHFHETLPPDEWLTRRLHSALRSFQLVVVPDAERSRLLRRDFESVRRLLVVPNYPILENSEPKLPTPPASSFDVVYGGSLGTDQMLHVVIKSVQHWPAEARLVLIGDDARPVARSLRALSTSLGLQDRVIFEGWVDQSELIPRFRSANLGISLLTSKTDQWRYAAGASNKRYQYMQAGLPQVSDQNPGITQLIEGNGIGKCVDETSEAQIAGAVGWYSRQPDLAAKQGLKAHQLYRSTFNYNRAFEPLRDWILEFSNPDCGTRTT